VRTAGAAAVLLALAGDARGADGGASANTGAQATGVLCLRKLPATIHFRTERKGDSGIFEEETDEARARRMAGPLTLEVSVDNAAAVIVDQKAGACIDGLALHSKHVVRSIRPGVSRQWGRFTFERGETVLELRYDPFYGNVQITPPARPAAAGVASCAVCPTAFPVKKRPVDVGGLAGQPPPPERRRVRGDRWPKPATVTCSEPLTEELPRMEGVTILDHGQRPVPPDLWEIEVVVRDARAAAALRKRGFKVELGEDPTEKELKDDVSSPGASKKAPKRH
jgi:hypothetical protein